MNGKSLRTIISTAITALVGAGTLSYADSVNGPANLPGAKRLGTRSAADSGCIVKPMAYQAAAIPSLCDVPPRSTLESTPRVMPPYYVNKRPGRYTSTDWQHIIDSTWGPGRPNSEKSNFWSYYWSKLNSDCALFVGLDSALWDSVYHKYNSEILGSVSRGRFGAILHHASAALRDGHLFACDWGVRNTDPLPGVPLMFPGYPAGGRNDHFGAGLTALPDSTALVYEVVPEHPLGLVPGDVILGYDRRRWMDIYTELDQAELPCGGRIRASSPSARLHFMIAASGSNWHLFDTIDVLKYGTSDTLHLPTDLLAGHSMPIQATEQLPVPGVVKPDFYSDEYVTWGIVAGTKFGYIYGVAWDGTAGDKWTQAIDTLMKLNTTGLIIDFRTNFGGNMWLAYNGLGRLFGGPVNWVGFAKRCSTADRMALCSSPGGDPSSCVIPDQPGEYTKPIALLTGPAAGSSGDMISLAVAFHPMTKVFGKPTGAFFNSPEFHTGDIDPDFYFSDVLYNCYLASNPGVYLTRKEFPSLADFPWVPYESVWLTRDGVAHGIDDVVEAAKRWIVSQDTDQDGIPNAVDNCPNIANPGQEDANHDSIGDACCCVAATGNVDCDPSDGVDISDLSALIDNLYINFTPLCCPKEANVDGQPGTDISDLSALIDYLYITFTSPAACL